MLVSLADLFLHTGTESVGDKENISERVTEEEVGGFIYLQIGGFNITFI